MSMEKLKELEREAARLRVEEESLKKAERALASLRISQSEMWDQIKIIEGGWRYGSDEIAKGALTEAINELKTDMYRIAELRLQARSREARVKAAQREAVLQASILTIPELEKEAT